MANALAVYSTKPAISGKRFAFAAAEAGIQLRFLSMGGAFPSDPNSFQRSLRLAGSGAALVVGAFETDHVALAEFDELVGTRNRTALAKHLNDGHLPWIELMTSAFNYEAHVNKFPKEKVLLTRSVSPDSVPHLNASATRYILLNQSKSKRGGELMRRLASVLATKSGGVVVKHSRPKR